VKNKKLLALALIFSISISQPVGAVESGSVRNCGVENIGNPYLAQATAYCEPGRLTATGSSAQEGIVAGPPEWIGSIAAVYLVASDGSIGDFLGLYPVEDTGYGHSLSVQGYKSSILKNKVPGTVETGITLDFREKSEADCYAFMLMTYTGSGTTGSQVWVQIIKGEG
jgi:hypothetical protein